jgi:hypothetical protein
LALCLGLKVPIDVLRDTDGRVSEGFRDDVERDALRQHETGSAVAELVNVAIAEARVFGNGFDHLSSNPLVAI